MLGEHRQSLAVVRSLHRAGYRVIVGRSGRRSVVARSRCVAEIWEHPRVGDRIVWKEALMGFLAERPDIGAVYPVGDHEIELTGPLTAQLPVLVVAASPNVFERCRSKRALFELADEAGVPTRDWAIVEGPGALMQALERIGLPAVLKPKTGNAALGFKASVIRSVEQARRIASRAAFPLSGMVLQQLTVGTRHNLYFVACRGRLLGLAQIRIERTDRLDGTGLAVEGCSVSPDPPLVAWTDVLVKRLAYSGVGCAQFIVGASPAPSSFLEINARLGANCASVCACGLDLPRLSMRWWEPLPASLLPPCAAAMRGSRAICMG